MSTEYYIKTLNERIKKLKNSEAEQLFNKWSYNYLIHSKSIHQYSPEIHILLLKYSLHLIYILLKIHPELSIKINKFISDNGLELNKIEKLSNNFDPDKYCIYEDFTNFIAKTFEAVENDYKEKVLNIKEFSDYAQMIAVYKLIVDLIDLVEIWKEKDEGLKKFQNLCKFRVVQIMREKKNYENSPEGKEYEREVQLLNDQIRQEKLMEEKRKKEMMDNKKNPPPLLKTSTIVQRSTNSKFNPFLNNNNLIQGKPDNNINNNNQFNPFSGGYSNPYNLPQASKIKKNTSKIIPKRKFMYGKYDKEAQEIHQMYMNYDPGEYQKVPDVNNSNNNNDNIYYNINPKPNIQVKDNIEEVMKNLLNGYEYPGSNEVKIKATPVLYKSEDYYKLRLHIKSVLIPKIISQLKKDESEEAYNNSKMLLYYLSIMNPK